MEWLITPEAQLRLEAEARRVEPSEVRRMNAAVAVGVPMHREGSEAVIQVRGVLTRRPNFLAMLLGGGTTYPGISEALREAQADPEVDRIRLEMDSPGGMTSGLFETLNVIRDVRKTTPISVLAESANSAAYAMAAVAGQITATSVGASFGSVGTVARIPVVDSLVTVASSDAPNKAPDPTTVAGRREIVKRLDAISALFVDAVAEGRGVSPSVVRSNFGQGASLLAQQALDAGMIDGVEGASSQPTVPSLSAEDQLALAQNTSALLQRLRGVDDEATAIEGIRTRALDLQGRGDPRPLEEIMEAIQRADARREQRQANERRLAAAAEKERVAARSEGRAYRLPPFTYGGTR